MNFFKQTMDVATSEFDPKVLEVFTRYSWPGNIRELRNIIERMLVLHGKDRTIRSEFLPEEFAPAARPDGPDIQTSSRTLESAVSSYERKLIEKALRDANGIRSRAAAALGTTRRILNYRIEKLQIQASPDDQQPMR